MVTQLVDQGGNLCSGLPDHRQRTRKTQLTVSNRFTQGRLEARQGKRLDLRQSVPREGRAPPDAVWHDAGRNWAASGARQALDKANHLSRLYNIALARADGNQDRIRADHADGCREIAETSRIGDEHRVPVG